MNGKFQMDLVLITAVEQYVAKYVMGLTLQRYPEVMDESEIMHDHRSQYFDCVYEEIMDNMQVQLNSKIWPSMKLPMEHTTILRLESKYDKDCHKAG